MRSERMGSLADFVISNLMNPMIVSSTQWLERTLDDSANKRLSVAEGFLACDGILDLYLNITDGMKVYPKQIERHLMEELPFMATENILMDAVKRGGDRQELHERIRRLSMEAGRRVKEEGLDNNLLQLIAEDPAFGISQEEIDSLLNPKKYIGAADLQTAEFLKKIVRPILRANPDALSLTAEITV